VLLTVCAIVREVPDRTNRIRKGESTQDPRAASYSANSRNKRTAIGRRTKKACASIYEMMRAIIIALEDPFARIRTVRPC
jgi:ribonuclease PH